jgi:hypothetical protein
LENDVTAIDGHANSGASGRSQIEGGAFNFFTLLTKYQNFWLFLRPTITQ